MKRCCARLRWAILSFFCLGTVRASEIDIEKFSFIGGKTEEEIIQRVGPPAARFEENETTHLLYDNAFKKQDDGRFCPELLFKKGKAFQINWLPEATMKKSVEAVKGFGDWKPPAAIVEKTFSVKDTGVVGMTRQEVEARLGGPDVKTIFNGKEVWQYHKVRLQPDRQLVIYIEFEDGKATSSAGN